MVPPTCRGWWQTLRTTPEVRARCGCCGREVTLPLPGRSSRGLPPWRVVVERDSHGGLVARRELSRRRDLADLRQACMLLGIIDADRGYPAHELGRFGDDREGRAMYAAYLDGYRQTEEPN